MDASLCVSGRLSASIQHVGSSSARKQSLSFASLACSHHSARCMSQLLRLVPGGAVQHCLPAWLFLDSRSFSFLCSSTSAAPNLPSATTGPMPGRLFVRNATLSRQSLWAQQRQLYEAAQLDCAQLYGASIASTSTPLADRRVSPSGADCDGLCGRRTATVLASMDGVQPCVDGRRSTFDLRFLAVTELLAVEDAHDDTFVATLQTRNNRAVFKPIAAARI